MEILKFLPGLIILGLVIVGFTYLGYVARFGKYTGSKEPTNLKPENKKHHKP